MIDRVSILQEPDIAALLRSHFVPLAIDQHVHRRLQDAEGRLFAAILAQAGKFLDGQAQGYFVVTPGGRLVVFENAPRPERVRRLLISALERFDSTWEAPGVVEEPRELIARFVPPEGGLVLDVGSRVLGGYDSSSSDVERMRQAALGRDYCWLPRAEAASLAERRLPQSLAKRLARFHFVDNTRGEPPRWEEDELRQLDMTFTSGRIAGFVHLESDDGDRRYRASVLGYVRARGGEVTGFDLVASGLFRGEGPYNPGAPAGDFPFAVRFSLVRGDRVVDRIPPGCARHRMEEYLRPEL